MWDCQPQVSSWVFRLWRNTGSMQWQGSCAANLILCCIRHTLHIFMGVNTLVISVFYSQSCTKVVRDGELGETLIKRIRNN